jgi:CRISPR-associated endoribonuclease Cas6
LNAEADAVYDNDYHYHLQGLVYSLIRKGGRSDVHGRSGYKFFCFSNIFPYHEKFERGMEENLLISSPDPSLISAICQALEVEKETNFVLEVGRSMRFSITKVEGPFRVRVPIGSPVRVRSATPIVIRIPSWRYADYGIFSNRPFENWRATLPLEAFVKQVRDNMEKKFKDFTIQGKDSAPSEGPLDRVFVKKTIFSNKSKEEEAQIAFRFPEIISYTYLKPVSKPITIRREKQQIIGSMWEFDLTARNKSEVDVIAFMLDCGLGERNSLGFGFLNTMNGRHLYQ